MTAPIIGEWPAWTFWQYTDKGIGPTYGVSSGNIDLNRFNGSKADLYRFCGLDVPAQEGDVSILEQRIKSIEDWKNKPLE